MKKQYFISLILIVLKNNSYAEPMTGEWELGFSSFTGNTKSNNLRASLNLEQHIAQWKHDLDFEALRNTNDGVLEAESYIVDVKSDYFYKQQTYNFVALRYEEDNFSSFKYQSSLSFGLGTRLIENDRENLDVSIGLGLQKSQEQNVNNSNTETIIRFGTEYLFQLNDNTQMTEHLLIELGKDNNKTISETSLHVYISEELTFKLSLSIKNNSATTLGIKNTDTQTSVSVIYAF